MRSSVPTKRKGKNNMKPLKNEIRDDCAERFGLRSSDLTFLGGGREDSDGIVYTALKDGVKYVLKISQAADEAHVESILKFAHYLGECGIRVSSPLKNA